VGPQTFMEDLEKIKIPWPYLESVVQPVTDGICQLGAIPYYVNRVCKFVFSRYRAPQLVHAPLVKATALIQISAMCQWCCHHTVQTCSWQRRCRIL